MIKKIRIIGAPGSWKSTLANKISKKLWVPYFELDDILYEKKYTLKRSKEERMEILDKLCKQDKWLFEGVSIGRTELTFEKSDLIIYLSISKRLLIKRLLFRHINRYRTITKRVSLFNIKNLFGLIQYWLSYDTKEINTNPVFLKYIKKTITLKTKKEIKSFIEWLENYK